MHQCDDNVRAISAQPCGQGLSGFDAWGKAIVTGARFKGGFGAGQAKNADFESIDVNHAAGLCPRKGAAIGLGDIACQHGEVKVCDRVL